MAATPPASSLPSPISQPARGSLSPMSHTKRIIEPHGKMESYAGKHGEHAPLSLRLAPLISASASYHSTSSSLQSHALSLHLDSLHHTLRSHFSLPLNSSLSPSHPEPSQPAVYFAGNSLGPMPKSLPKLLQEELVDAWGPFAVLGHTEHPLGRARDWVTIEKGVVGALAQLVGGRESEVAAMGSLTTNLHTLLSSFYRPTPSRHKILFEHNAFPSDTYAFASHAEARGQGETSLRTIKPREGEWCLRTDDILHIIEEEGDEVAVVCLSGVQYYTGQVFEMERITKAAHAKGCLVGWDLAHAVGNVPLDLHEWGVDFAAWCGYKYLCGGPGGMAGIFVHDKWADRARLQGWWGHTLSTRFQMPPTFVPQPGAQGWQHSNPSVLTTLSLSASLDIFIQASRYSAQSLQGDQQAELVPKPFLSGLREKSLLLTDYLELRLRSLSQWFRDPEEVSSLLQAYKSSGREAEEDYLPSNLEEPLVFTILTPPAPHRGSQLSLLFHPASAMQDIFNSLRASGVLGDERQPGVIRFAPCPLFNTFEEVWKATEALEEALKSWDSGREERGGRRRALRESAERLEKGEGSIDGDLSPPTPTTAQPPLDSSTLTSLHSSNTDISKILRDRTDLSTLLSSKPPSESIEAFAHRLRREKYTLVAEGKYRAGSGRGSLSVGPERAWELPVDERGRSGGINELEKRMRELQAEREGGTVGQDQ